MNSSWEQNASAANDSGDWGGWGSGVGAAAKPADQDNSWKVHAKVPDTVAGAQKLKILYDIV